MYKGEPHKHQHWERQGRKKTSSPTTSIPEEVIAMASRAYKAKKCNKRDENAPLVKPRAICTEDCGAKGTAWSPSQSSH